MKRNDDFDSRLETELRRRLHGASAAPPPHPRYKAVAAGGGHRLRVLSGAGAAFAAKAGTGLVVAAFAVGATGTALSGSPNPTAWGTTVHQVVDQCKAGSTVEGIGGCVSAIAQEHNDTPAPAPAHTPAASEPGHPAPPAAAATPGDKHEDSGKPESPRPTERPEHRPSPAPTARPSAFPRPSPSESGEGDH